MKNIGFAKIGKSIKFETKNYSPVGGDNEASAILQALANNNPDKTFYLVGRSDFSRLSDDEVLELFPYNNVIDCYKGSKDLKDNPNYLIEWLKNNNVTIDFAFMMMGQIGNVTIPNRVYGIRDPNSFVSIIDMTKGYSTPVINWLNETPDLKWIEIINDPRYTKAQAKDFISEPLVSLGQFDYTYDHHRIKSFEDQERIHIDHKVSYAGMETGFCIDRSYPDITKIKKTNKFMVILNEGNPSRYKSINEWILSNFQDVEIYGKWEHESALNDSRFKGSIHIDEVQSKVKSTKYTFIIPIAKGWVTSKYIEMIHAGCIPFFHPDYDMQHHIDVPDLLRVKNPKQLMDTIAEMEKDDSLRLDVLEYLQKSVLKPEYYDGTFMNNQLMSNAYKILGSEYTIPDLNKFSTKKQDIISLF